MVGRVAGEMDDFCLRISGLEDLVLVVEEAVESNLQFTTSGTAAETVLDFYKQAIPAASVARAIAFAVEQPDDVDVNAIVIRPTAQEF